MSRSEAYFRALVENSLDAVAVVDAEGIIRYESPSAEHILGYRPEELIGRNALEFLHPEDVQRVADNITTTKENPGRSFSTEMRFLHKDGTWRVLEGVGCNLLHDPDVKGIVTNYRDITERKRSEAALRESEEKYRTILEGIGDGYYEVDIAGDFTFFNDRMCEMIGYSKDEMIGMNNRQYMDKQNARKVYRAFNRAYTTGKHGEGFDWELTTKDGTKRFVEASVSLRTNSDGEPIGFRGIVRDITERKRSEAALRASQAELATLVTNVADAVFRFKEGRLTWANDRIQEMLGYTRDEMLDIDVNLFVSDDVDLGGIYEAVDAGLKARGIFHGITRVKKKDGSVADVEYSASPIPGKDPVELVGIACDVTERKKMEEALQRSEERLKLYLEMSPDGVYISDLKGTFLYGNRAAERIVGYSREELVGKSFLELGLLPPEYMPQAAKGLERNAAGELAGPEEYELIRKDGDRVFVEISAIPVGHGSETEVVGIARDITERKKMEQQLLLSGRLASVGELAAGVAHELNNPLAAVQGFAQLLSDRKDLDEITKSDVDVIYREAQRATRITRNLLSFARKHKPEKSLISINEVIDKSVELHSYRMKVNNMEIVTELDPDLPMTMADFYQMQQVFGNIITNAEQAMTREHGGGHLVVRTHAAGETIQAIFTNDGPGIAEDNLKKLFDPFFTTKEVGEGTGLGLSICYGIVQEHGGRIYAESKAGEGTTFVVEMPVVCEAFDTEGANPAHYL